MTYNTTTPNAAQSPFLFPPAANINFARLKTIIAGDHIFNDTAQANDGTHKEVTLTNRTDPVSLPATTNGILYSKNDYFNQPQLFWYNGAATSQLTDQFNVYPIRSAGSISLASNGKQIVFPLNLSTDIDWGGTAYCYTNVNSQINYSAYNVVCISGNTLLRQQDTKDNTSQPPTFTFIANPNSPFQQLLYVVNNSTNSQIVYWSVIVNRIINTQTPIPTP